MVTFDEAYREWEGLMLSKQTATLLRRGMLGDGNGVVNVPGRPGWSWIRYSEEQSKLSQVRNVLFGYAADGTPVVVGKAHADDDYEQVLRVDWAPYMQHLTPDRISQYAVAPHGDTHHGTHGNDPSYIDLNNIVVGKVIPTDPASLSVYVEAFVYAYGTDLETFPGGPIDLTASVPGAGLHRYVLVYLTMATGILGLTDGVTVPLPVAAEIPDALNGTIPLGVVELEAGQTEIVAANIWQYKVIWCGIGYTGVHTHTDNASGGSSIIDLEELIFECAEPLFLMGNAIWPVNTYHSLYIESMYISGLVAEADLTWIHADPIHGCGQILIIHPVAPDMYTSYKINVRHGVGNIWLSGGADIILDESTDHLWLIYNGQYWCDDLGGGAAAGVHTHANAAEGGATISATLYNVAATVSAVFIHSANVVFDDGAGDSPQLQFIPQNDDVWAIFAEDAIAGNSDLIVTMPAADADARFIWRNSTPADVAWVSAAGSAFFSTATAGNIGLIVRTTDDDLTNSLTEWQDSAGAVLLSVLASGDLFTDRWAGQNTNTIIGVEAAGRGNLNIPGTANTLVGYRCGWEITEGNNNVALGANALRDVTTGFQNMAIGGQALWNLTTGNSNVGLGHQACAAVTDSVGNMGIGFRALYRVTTGDSNVGIGTSSLEDVTITSYNVGIGSSAGGNITGSGNIFIGRRAGFSVGGAGAADYNVIIGYQAGWSITNGSDKNVFVGFEAGFSEVGSDKLYIENSNSVAPLIYGEFDNDLLRLNAVTILTNTVHPLLHLRHQTGGAAVAGFGIGQLFELEENDGTIKTAGIIECKWSDAGEGVNADAYFDFKTMLNDGAAASVMVVGYNGNVGIGVVPGSRLHVFDNVGNTAMILEDNAAANVANVVALSLRADTTVATRSMIDIVANFSDIVHATRTSLIRFYTVEGGAFAVALALVGHETRMGDYVGGNYLSVEGNGDTKWVGGGGLVFGGCYGNHIGWQQVAAVQNTWYNISIAAMNSAPLHLVTHDGNGKLTVTEPGRYMITYSICFQDNIANDHLEGGVEINGSGVAEPQAQCHLENKFANEEEHMGSGNSFDLADNSTIEVCIRTTDAGTPDIDVQAVNISVVMVGGT